MLACPELSLSSANTISQTETEKWIEIVEHGKSFKRFVKF